MKVLVFSPHCDDEILGVGGTLLRLASEGHEIYDCIVTKPYTPDWSRKYISNRKKEIRSMRKMMNFTRVYELGFPAVKLDMVSQKELNDRLSEVVSDIKPDVVFIPHRGDLNMDHRIVHDAALVALRPYSTDVKVVYAYETLSETEWGVVPFVPNVYFDITDMLLKKLAVMQLFKSELRRDFHPRSLDVISALSRKRGSEYNLRFAEAFMLMREIK